MQEQVIQKKIEKSLARYVAMNTIATDVPLCSAAIKGLASELQKVGMFVRTQGPMHPWLIATTTQRAHTNKHVKILFVIHFDIVPPISEGQLTLRVPQNKLLGRGVYDMKFAAACIKEVIANYARNGSLSLYDFGVLITTDEEKGGYDGALDFLQSGWRCDLAIVPDGGGSWKIERRAKGISYVYLTAHGKSAHSSQPWKGDNPISKLTPVMDQITQRYAATNNDPAAVTVSINSVETSNGVLYNTTQIPEWAKASISVRAFTSNEITDAQNYIKEVADAHGVNTTITLDDAPVHFISDNVLTKTYAQLLTEVTGKPAEFVDALGASDARHFAKYDIPTVLMYINGGGYHSAEEWIERKDLYQFYSFTKEFISRVARTNEPEAKDSLTKYRRLLKPLLRR